jgi:hypothetical protein
VLLTCFLPVQGGHVLVLIKWMLAMTCIVVVAIRFVATKPLNLYFHSFEQPFSGEFYCSQ